MFRPQEVLKSLITVNHSRPRSPSHRSIQVHILILLRDQTHLLLRSLIGLTCWLLVLGLEELWRRATVLLVLRSCVWLDLDVVGHFGGVVWDIQLGVLGRAVGWLLLQLRSVLRGHCGFHLVRLELKDYIALFKLRCVLLIWKQVLIGALEALAVIGIASSELHGVHIIAVHSSHVFP